ncbi:MAG: hypothetical protein M1482_09515 [Chloroflexi bacterium]|nr:hypothetical protein [Chloroflexota bacterium]
MPSKLSIHLSAYPSRVFDVLQKMQPSVVKVYNFSSEMNIDEVRRRCPNVVIVYRQYTNQDFRAPADAFFAEIGDTLIKLRGRGIYWEGLNEPVVKSVDDAKALNAWYVRFAELMHAQGEKVAGFSWSTGNPTPDVQSAIVPFLVDAAAAVDVHAFHEYYSRAGEGKDWGCYRTFEQALPQAARRPVVITEAGLDDNGDPYIGGWRGHKTPQEYLEILKGYDAILLQDPYVLGATLFQWGDYGWPSFELTNVIDLLTAYVQSAGGGAAIPQPWPVLETPAVPVYSFSVSPDTIQVGQSAELKWDVDGAKSVMLDGQAVADHGTWAVTPTQTTTYTLRLEFSDGSAKELSTTVTVQAPQATYTFSSTPGMIQAGESSVLSWDVQGVRSVALDGQAVAGHDTRTVTPAKTTTYTLQLVLFDGSTKDLQATVTVQIPQAIYAFSATPETILLGQSTVLKWDVEGVKSVALDGQAVAGHDTRTVTPAQTTTYVMRLGLYDGSTKDLPVTVTVQIPQAIYAFSATPETILLGQSTVLKWDVEGVKSVALDGQAVAGHDTRTVTPAQTTTYVMRLGLYDGSTKELPVTVTVQIPQPTYAFSATPATVQSGQSSVLEWDVEGYKSVALDGQAVDGHDTRTVTPAQTATYTLQLVLHDGSTKDLPTTVTVEIPPTYAFTATPATVQSGQSVALNWDVEGVKSVALDHETVEGHGTRTVKPTQTTIYVLHLEFLDGTAKDLAATVLVQPPRQPTTSSFSVEPASITAGAQATLKWATQGASRITLDDRPVAASGTETVSPTVTTVYGLHVEFVDGSTRDLTALLTVQPPPLEKGATFAVDPNTIVGGGPATLTWATKGATVVLLNGQAVATSGSQMVAPAQTTTYTLHVEFEDKTVKDLTVAATVAPTLVTGPTRSPTVVLTAQNVAQLKTYPRPVQDNGRGLHFTIDLRDSLIASTVQNLNSIRCKWTMIYAQDELQAGRAAKACWNAGIMPVVRIGKKIDEPFDPAAYVKALTSVGAPPYVQLYNEPGDSREWNHLPASQDLNHIFGGRWAAGAQVIFEAGGYPGIQCLDPMELKAAVESAGKSHPLWQKAFFVQHNYGANHPPAYPYDARNQQDHPNATILDDNVGVLAFLDIAHWMMEYLGFVIPIVGGEGGWEYGADQDNRYPKAEQPYHARYHAEMFEWFQTGVLSNGEPLPDYVFSITPWIAGGWGADDWWGGVLGDKTETINAVAALVPFVRKFSWDAAATTPNLSFTAAPASLAVGASATLDWQVDGADKVTLDGAAVAAYGTRIVTPATTTTYVLHVAFPDGTSHDLSATVTVAVPAPPTGVQWDSRLDGLGVKVKASEAAHSWRVVAAQLEDPGQTGQNHHVYLKAQSADGSPAAGIPFVIDWVGRDQGDQPATVTTDSKGEANCPLWATFSPSLKNGIYSVTTAKEAGDAVSGMGLPDARHVNFILTFKHG